MTKYDLEKENEILRFVTKITDLLPIFLQRKSV